MVKLSEQFVPVKVDAEKDRSVAKKFKVRSFPTIVFADAKGKSVGKILGYLPPDRFAEKMEEIARVHRELTGMQAKFDTDPSDLALGGQIAAAYAARGTVRPARKLIKLIEESDANNEKGYLNAAYLAMGDYYSDEKEDYRSAVKWYTKAVETAKDSAVISDAYYRIAMAHFQSSTTAPKKTRKFARRLTSAQEAIGMLLAIPDLPEELKQQANELLENVKKELQEHEELRAKKKDK